MHLFWLALFVPAVMLGQWIWPVLKQRSIWFVLMLIMVALTVGWLAMGLTGLKSNQWTVNEISRVLAFRLAAYTDLPLIQLLAASMVGWLFSKRAPEPLVAKPESPESGSELAAG